MSIIAGTRARCVPVLNEIVSILETVHLYRDVDSGRGALQDQACGLFLGLQEWQKLQAEIHEAGEVHVNFGVEFREAIVGWLGEIDRVLGPCVQEDTVDIWMIRDSSLHYISLISLRPLY